MKVKKHLRLKKAGKIVSKNTVEVCKPRNYRKNKQSYYTHFHLFKTEENYRDMKGSRGIMPDNFLMDNGQSNLAILCSFFAYA